MGKDGWPALISIHEKLVIKLRAHRIRRRDGGSPLGAKNILMKVQGRPFERKRGDFMEIDEVPLDDLMDWRPTISVPPPPPPPSTTIPGGQGKDKLTVANVALLSGGDDDKRDEDPETRTASLDSDMTFNPEKVREERRRRRRRRGLDGIIDQF
ncbi:hypothetical protein BSKO_11031 [Bryopsis sp. KO-2023]|nr:hypothetical protein BSKO_11031 [Bryopsis sp. KO-2023]